MSTGRMEAFSDGVFAVAITLLVLNVAVPAPHRGGSLVHDLLRGSAWPHYVAYLVSFLTIGIIWINHHGFMLRLRAADHALMVLNVLLLMAVVAIPFTTNLVATYLTAGYGHGLSAGLYAGSFLVMAFSFLALQRHTLYVKPLLLAGELSAADRRRIWLRNRAGVAPYVVATAIAPISGYASVALCGAVAVFYALPFSVESDA